MRIAGVLYTVLSLAINFLIGSDVTMLYALPSFPIVVWLLTTKRKKKSVAKPVEMDPVLDP